MHTTGSWGGGWPLLADGWIGRETKTETERGAGLQVPMDGLRVCNAGRMRREEGANFVIE